MSVRILFSILSFIVFNSCGGGVLYNRPTNSVRTKVKIEKNHLHLLSLFVNKRVTWRAEAERYSSYFHNLDPIAEIFSKRMLTTHGVNLNRFDFPYLAKKHSVTYKEDEDYIKAGKTVFTKNLKDHSSLFSNNGTDKDYYLVMETQFSVRVSYDDILKTDLEVNLIVLDSKANTVFYQYYSYVHKLTEEDRKKVYYWQQHKPRECEIRMTEIYVQSFLRLTGKILKDLGTLF